MPPRGIDRLRRNEYEGDAQDIHVSIAHRALKRLRFSQDSTAQRYLDMRFLVHTSNMCDSLFYKARYALNDRRKCIFLQISSLK